MAVNVETVFFWVVMLCHIGDGYQHSSKKLLTITNTARHLNSDLNLNCQ